MVIRCPKRCLRNSGSVNLTGHRKSAMRRAPVLLNRVPTPEAGTRENNESRTRKRTSETFELVKTVHVLHDPG